MSALPMLGASPSATVSPRPSRRTSTRRAIEIPCQVVRERGFRLLAEQTLDLSVEGMLVPLGCPVDGGESVIASFAIPGTWIDVEAVVTRVVQGRRPYDDAPAVGLRFVRLSSSSRAALAGFLHGRPPPLPRRGPFARLRRGESLPRLADEALMTTTLFPSAEPRSRVRPVLGLALDDLFDDEEDLVTLDDADVFVAEEPADSFGLGVLVELAAAWRKLGEAEG